MSEFQTQAVKWIDAQTLLYKDKISKRKAEYLKNKWAWDEKKAAGEFNARLTELQSLRSSLLVELSYEKTHGQNLLDLANIVFNEAGASSLKGKVAIAYAWLNRTKGVMREPKSTAEVSHYVSLLNRWAAVNDTGRMTFLKNFAQCLNAARQRLSDGDPRKNDPTKGATHWVSPIALPAYNKQKDRYERTVGKAVSRGFPLWARSNSDPAVAAMKKKSQVSSTYAELTLPGIDSTEFLFYTGVNY